MKAARKCWRYAGSWLLSGVLAGIPATQAAEAQADVRAAQPSRALSLAEAMQLLASRNRDLQLARRNVEAAEADRLSARARPNPNLSLSVLALRPHIGIGPGADPGGATDTIVGLSQLFERGRKRALRGEAASFALDAARGDLADTRRQQGILVAVAYYDLMLAQERLRVVEDTVGLLVRTVAATEVRLAAGDVAQSDLSRIRVDRLRAQNDLRQAGAERDRSRQALAYLLGIESEADRLVAVDAWPSAEPTTRTADMRMVVDRRADTRAAAGRVLAAEKVRDLALALRTRDVVVSGHYERFQGQVTNGTVGVGVSVPLFVNYRFDGEIRRAEAGVGAARDLLERTRAAAVTEINRAWTDLAAASDRVQRFDTALLGEATRAADAAEFAYRNGALGVIDLLDARRVLYATRTEAVAAHAELARALWAWRAATTSYEGTE